jgi:hypothetical protein
VKVWHLRPVDENTGPWKGWFDCMFAFIVRAPNEDAARSVAAREAAEEGADAWLSPNLSHCTVS